MGEEIPFMQQYLTSWLDKKGNYWRVNWHVEVCAFLYNIVANSW